jgi:hypothetical protein
VKFVSEKGVKPREKPEPKPKLIPFRCVLWQGEASSRVLLQEEGKSMKKRQQGDDENKKEVMAMTALKRRATNDSIKHTRLNSEV